MKSNEANVTSAVLCLTRVTASEIKCITCQTSFTLCCSIGTRFALLFSFRAVGGQDDYCTSSWEKCEEEKLLHDKCCCVRTEWSDIFIGLPSYLCDARQVRKITAFSLIWLIAKRSFCCFSPNTSKSKLSQISGFNKASQSKGAERQKSIMSRLC